MNDFDLSIQEGKVMAGSTDIPMLIVGEQRDLWFRGNNLTAFLEYAQPRVALTKILKTRNTKTCCHRLFPIWKQPLWTIQEPDMSTSQACTD